MGIFSFGSRRAARSAAGQKAFRTGKRARAKDAAAHAETVRRRAEFKAKKRARGL
jgi:hypothetical protein